MIIKKLKLYTHELDLLRGFYTSTLGFELTENDSDQFSLQVGQTKLSFEKSEKKFIYHFCFLIPSNKLHESVAWLQERLDVITYENGRVIEAAAEDWNADSVYFLDPTGNILEFIVRYDLNNERIDDGFDTNNILCVNEIGMPSSDLHLLNDTLTRELDVSLWTGNLERFGASGTQSGMFLLVNYNKKEHWFPTQVKPMPSPFSGTFETNGELHNLIYRDEKVVIVD